MARLMKAILVGLAFLVATGSASVASSASMYDAPAIARVEFHDFGAAEVNPTKFNDALEESASPLIEARGAPTTPFTRVVATEGVGGAADDVVSITKPYQRPSGATTPAQRASVQGQPCVDCGTISPVQVADHKVPLVQEYYTTGAIDTVEMRTLEAVQAQCPTCSARQGAAMAQYSKIMKQVFGLG